MEKKCEKGDSSFEGLRLVWKGGLLEVADQGLPVKY